jgi:hypothetical protein
MYDFTQQKVTEPPSLAPSSLVRKGQLLPNADAGPEGWSSRDKFAAVLETAALNEADLAEYCRKRGLYPAHIAAWRSACEQANDWDRANSARLGRATKQEKKRVKDL